MGIAKIDDPDSIKCTLQFTMSLGNWKRVGKTLALNSDYAETKVIAEIMNLVSQLEKTFHSDVEVE